MGRMRGLFLKNKACVPINKQEDCKNNCSFLPLWHEYTNVLAGNLLEYGGFNADIGMFPCAVKFLLDFFGFFLLLLCFQAFIKSH